MVIPIYDNDPLEKSHRAYVTFALIAINIAIYAFQDATSDKVSTEILLNFALFPVALTGDAVTGGFLPTSLSIVSYMFLHGGWMHVLFNMLFLWVFGDNIEDAIGHGRYLVFYLLCGMAGGAAHVLAAPQSNVPLIGASGAIAGVIAAYLMIRPCAKITVLLFGFVPIRLASYWVLGFWVLTQVWHVFTLQKGDTPGGRISAGLRPALSLSSSCGRPVCCCSSACDRRMPSWQKRAQAHGVRRDEPMLRCVDRVLVGP